MTSPLPPLPADVEKRFRACVDAEKNYLIAHLELSPLHTGEHLGDTLRAFLASELATAHQRMEDEFHVNLVEIKKANFAQAVAQRTLAFKTILHRWRAIKESTALEHGGNPYSEGGIDTLDSIEKDLIALEQEQENHV